MRPGVTVSLLRGSLRDITTYVLEVNLVTVEQVLKPVNIKRDYFFPHFSLKIWALETFSFYKFTKRWSSFRDDKDLSPH